MSDLNERLERAEKDWNERVQALQRELSEIKKTEAQAQSKIAVLKNEVRFLRATLGFIVGLEEVHL